MKIEIQNQLFGILVYSALNHKRRKSYVVCYGLQVKVFSDQDPAENLIAAMREYDECLRHAKDCAGLND